MLAFYKRFCDVKDQKFDGLLITGAPVEHLPFEQVDWGEITVSSEPTNARMGRALRAFSVVSIGLMPPLLSLIHI